MFDLTRREAVTSGMAAAAFVTWGTTLRAAMPASGAQWDLTDIYPTDLAWEADRQALLKVIPRLAALRGKLGNSATSLKTAMKAQSDVYRSASRLSLYASLKADEDVRNSPNQERNQQVRDIYTAIGEATAWIDPELVSLGAARVNALIAEDRGLDQFAFGLRDTLRQSLHTLSPDEERLLAAAGAALSGPGTIRSQLVNSDMPRPTVKLSDGREIKLDNQGYTIARSFPNRADRKVVFDKFWASYKEFENSLGAALAAQISISKFRAKARNYETALQASLDSSNVPEAVYRSLIFETNRGLPVLHRYFELRRRMLGLSEIGYWDLYPPLVQSDRTYSLAEMRRLTIDAIRPLGADYVRLFSEASAKRWMDPLPRPGKTPGAYMKSVYDVHPYLLLNLSDKYDGLTTYAHEWGHAMHSLLATAAQPFELAHYPTFTGEVASTTHELLLASMLAERAKTKDEKLFYLGQIMENYRATFFRQAMFAEFQLAIHDLAAEGEGLSGAKMSALFLDLLRRYHGPKVQIDTDYGSEWAYVPHFHSGFYVWQYSTSIAAANFFAQKIMHGTPTDVTRYLSVLRAGGSDYGYNLLKIGGLDMATAEPYGVIVDSFSNVLDQAEALIV